MTTDKILEATLRTETGSGAARRLRREGILPASVVLLDGGTVDVSLNQHDFDLILQRHAGENLILDVSVADKGDKKLRLAEVQRDYVSGRSMHADFLEISMTEKMQIAIPVELTGDSVGVGLGGVMEQLVREVEVECMPSDLIESITVDITDLDIGGVITVGDLTVDSNLTVLTAEDVAIVHVQAQKAEEEVAAEEEAEEGEEGAEPEVIGKEEDTEEDAG
jgi:large subunit ribosomal protein L25